MRQRMELVVSGGNNSFIKSSNTKDCRHNIDLTTTQLIQCEICVLDFDDRLCALKARNMINARDSILVQIECLRLEAKLKTSSGYFVDLHPLSNRKSNITLTLFLT